MSFLVTVPFYSSSHVTGDINKLHRDYQSLPEFRYLLDLSKLAMHVDKTRWSWRRNPLIRLDELTRCYLDKDLDKGDVHYSNWQARGNQMTDKQLDCKLFTPDLCYTDSACVILTVPACRCQCRCYSVPSFAGQA